MRQEQLNSAYERLEVDKPKSSKRLVWLFIGIVVGIIVVVLFLLFWASRINPLNSYPYIPVPRNTARSASLPELLGNIFMDVNESAPDYSVISRQEILKSK